MKKCKISSRIEFCKILPGENWNKREYAGNLVERGGSQGLFPESQGSRLKHYWIPVKSPVGKPCCLCRFSCMAWKASELSVSQKIQDGAPREMAHTNSSHENVTKFNRRCICPVTRVMGASPNISLWSHVTNPVSRRLNFVTL